MLAIALLAVLSLGASQTSDLAAQWPSCPTVKGKAVYGVMVFGVNEDGVVTSTSGLIGDPGWLDEAAAEAKRVTMPQPMAGSYYGLFCTNDATPRLGYVFDQAPLRSGKPPAHVAPVVAQSNLDKRVEPKYPALARSRFIQGAVKLDVIIGPEGNIAVAVPTSGHPELFHAAVDAVRKWKYKPFSAAGKAVPVETVVTIPFAVNR